MQAATRIMSAQPNLLASNPHPALAPPYPTFALENETMIETKAANRWCAEHIHIVPRTPGRNGQARQHTEREYFETERQANDHVQRLRATAEPNDNFAVYLDPRACPECGAVSEDDGQPVTVGGWHGDICYGWGRYAGAHMCQATRYRCPKCKTERSAEPDWD
jgi:predicted Zn-ribbon and HTH transcriptional regulator